MLPALFDLETLPGEALNDLRPLSLIVALDSCLAALVGPVGVGLDEVDLACTVLELAVRDIRAASVLPSSGWPHNSGSRFVSASIQLLCFRVALIHSTPRDC
jgi:hypothetical protein